MQLCSVERTREVGEGDVLLYPGPDKWFITIPDRRRTIQETQTRIGFSPKRKRKSPQKNKREERTKKREEIERKSQNWVNKPKPDIDGRSLLITSTAGAFMCNTANSRKVRGESVARVHWGVYILCFKHPNNIPIPLPEFPLPSSLSPPFHPPISTPFSLPPLQFVLFPTSPFPHFHLYQTPGTNLHRLRTISLPC